MDLKQLTYIVTIAETGNISKAAHRLFISQPALSLYLSRLEDSLGLTLFERQKYTMIPTQAGVLYINAAKEILAIKQQLYINLNKLSTQKDNNLDIGVLPLTFSDVIPYIYSHYKQSNINLQITESLAHTLENMILTKEIKLALLAYTEELHSEIKYHLIYREPFYIAISKNHPLIQNGSLRAGMTLALRDIATEPFILSPSKTVRRQVENQAFNSAKVKPSILCEINNILSIEQMVSNNEGLAFFAKSHIKKHDNLMYFPIDCNPEWNLGIAYLKKSDLSVHEKHFINLISNFYKTSI